MQRVNTSGWKNKVSNDSQEKFQLKAREWNFTIHKFPAELEGSKELMHYVAFYISLPAMRTPKTDNTADQTPQKQFIRNYLDKLPSKYSDTTASWQEAGTDGKTQRQVEVDKINKSREGLIANVRERFGGDPNKEADAEIARINRQSDEEISTGLFDTLKRNRYISAKEAICLYIPEALSTAHDLQWNTEGMRGSTQLANAAKDIIKSASDTELTNLGPVDAVIGGTGAAAGAALAAGVGALLQTDMVAAGAKIVANPYMEMLFKQVGNRKLQMNFKFTPKTPDEAMEVRNIIQTFKKYAHPKMPNADGGGAMDMLKTFFYYPAEWDIMFYTIIDGVAVQNRFLSRYGRSVLDNIQVDYGAAGTTAFLRPDDMYMGAPPVETDLSLSFTEVDLLTADMIEDESLGF